MGATVGADCGAGSGTSLVRGDGADGGATVAFGTDPVADAGSAGVDDRAGSVALRVRFSGSLRVAGRSAAVFSAAFFSTAGRLVERGLGVGRGGGASVGRTIFGASGIGTVTLVCGVGLASPSSPRTGAVCSVCAIAGPADASIVMVASRAASAPRSVVIVENPLRAVVALLWAGEAERGPTATRDATSRAWVAVRRGAGCDEGGGSGAVRGSRICLFFDGARGDWWRT